MRPRIQISLSPPDNDCAYSRIANTGILPVLLQCLPFACRYPVLNLDTELSYAARRQLLHIYELRGSPLAVATQQCKSRHSDHFVTLAYKGKRNLYTALTPSVKDGVTIFGHKRRNSSR